MEKFIFRLKQFYFFQVLTVAIRYLLGSAFVWASILKIKGMRFTPQKGEHDPINSLSHLLESMYRSGFLAVYRLGATVCRLFIDVAIFQHFGCAGLFSADACHFYSNNLFSITSNSCDYFTNAACKSLFTLMGLEQTEILAVV